MRTGMAAALAAIGLSLTLSACETATPYQPLQRGSHISGGFSDQKLDADHFRVSFKGNTDTPRAKVESYLLYRAAELTVAQGYDWFETVDRHTETKGETWVDPFYGPGYRWGGFRPYWSFYGPGYGYGWRGGPWGPYWGGYDVQTVEAFEASAEIVMRHGPKPAGDPRGLDAREVLANLGPQVQRPTK